jgi:hypothetical protein
MFILFLDFIPEKKKFVFFHQNTGKFQNHLLHGRVNKRTELALAHSFVFPWLAHAR